MEGLLCFVGGVSVIALYEVAQYIYNGRFIGHAFNIIWFVVLAAVVIANEIDDWFWAAATEARRLRLPVKRIRALVADPWILRHRVWACETEADVVALEQNGTWPWPRTSASGAKKME
jgi:hypothetical protein